MARPSVKEERGQLILDAFERCIVRYGVEGSTLQKIADEAGIARALLRHHVGNREKLIESLADRFFKRSAEDQRRLLEYLPAEKRVQTLIDTLFYPSSQEDFQDVLVAEALIAASIERPWLKQKVLEWYSGFDELLESELKDEYKKAKPQEIKVVTSGISSIYASACSLALLGDINEIFARSKKAAELLIKGLA